MSTDLFTLNPLLKPLKKDREETEEAIEEFRRTFDIEPVYFVCNPLDWRSGMSAYCGLVVVKDSSVARFRLSV